MSYMVTLVNFPHFAIEEKRFDSIEAAVKAARETGFECAIWKITPSSSEWVKRVSPI